MSPLSGSRWRAANAELERALDLGGEERAAWLASLRAREPGLAADVQTLLDRRAALNAAGFLEHGPEGAQVTHTEDGRSEAAVAQAFALANGTVFGPYRIVRPLGRGGMGVVYEADEIDSGRHVALKVLARPRQDEHERERFEREGRLASSVNHPHCVFVFGATEIAHHPVIAMEIMQGTLADRLKTGGPLPPAAAVDAILQLVAGLEAAATAGILHRDVKPSNCFIDAHGVIKIGDFGISRSQRPTDRTVLSTLGRPAATPAYASPEQLRGGALDVRADVYSIGATLYELLTGRRPFDAADLMALLMAVANDTPAPPHAIVAAVPKGLSAVVLQCLAKKPAERFPDYDALIDALEPFSSTALSPATLGRRVAAGVIDHGLVGLPISITTVWALLSPSWVLWSQQLAWWLLLLYFGVIEGLWAATPGKAVFKLVVVDAQGRPPRMAKAFARAGVYVALFAIPTVVWLVWVQPDPSRLLEANQRMAVAQTALQVLMIAALFSTARRRNGYAGLHDLATNTRVVGRRLRGPRRPRAPIRPESQGRDVIGRVGPFDVLAGQVCGMPIGWRPGFDPKLQREIWIRTCTPGTPPISIARTSVNRDTRLRWLAGRRNSAEAWDVYEAVSGLPLNDACGRPRDWADVRWWLLDLARECAADSADDRPPRRLDRVWVLDSGRAKLVDDPCIDREEAAPIDPALDDRALLLAVARTARGDPRSSKGPWAVGAQQLLNRLGAEPALDMASIVGSLETLTRQRAVVTRGWRALPIAITMFVPMTIALFVAAFMAFLLVQWSRVPVEARIVAEGLRTLDRANRGRITLPAEDREAIEATLATRYRATLEDRSLFTSINALTMSGQLRPEYLGLADDLVRRHVAEVDPREGPDSPAVETLVKRATDPEPPPWAGVVTAVLVVCCFFLAVASLAAALMFRGGLMRLFGLELVTVDGQPASRVRVLARAAIAWSPVLALTLALIGSRVLGNRLPDPIDSATLLLWATPLFIMLVGASVAIVHPPRGVPDWLAGTWIVPR